MAQRSSMAQRTNWGRSSLIMLFESRKTASLLATPHPQPPPHPAVAPLEQIHDYNPETIGKQIRESGELLKAILAIHILNLYIYKWTNMLSCKHQCWFSGYKHHTSVHKFPMNTTRTSGTVDWSSRGLHRGTHSFRKKSS